MRSIRRWINFAAVTLFSGMVAAHLAWSQGAAAHSDGEAKERARIVLSKRLTKLAGDHLKAVLVEVQYGPGEASLPHSHPCDVIGYVVEGTLRTQVQGEPEMIYKAGESFYEAPNSVHLVSANASQKVPLRFIAFFTCDHEAPLSTDVPENKPAGGK
jgi:quercetin dioxygenase-like cupin family protein